MLKITTKSNYENVTYKWLQCTSPNSHKVIKQYFFDFNNKRYLVDNIHVVFDISKKELEVAYWIVNNFGGELYLLPRINKPDGIKTPDYKWNNTYWDLKEIFGVGKNVLFHAVEHQEYQAHNFIFDISDSRLTNDDVLCRLNKLLLLRKMQWIETIIVKRNNKVVIIMQKSSPSD